MSFRPFKARRKARQYALQALYGWLISNNKLKDIEEDYLQEHKSERFDITYFQHVLYNVPKCSKELDMQISPFLKRSLDRIDPVELTVLRLATYELQYYVDIPYRVIINEALELSKSFGATDSYKLINSVLDLIAKKMRSAEHYTSKSKYNSKSRSKSKSKYNNKI